ncbi:DUF6358 family protein [Mucilaginibacter sp. RS28]|uniref:DUF6358 family protein n=1 Tax=Mucilaginibacter straminoryzae TaxID=2932774 RepID=A0A9X2BC41_9SPHI|nr:DUF6358 family protein [Mucilaginibacter straminoryzae]MCJ8210497.1 DUF6358 family protein [Mucilaginibacter straminoryzae]
MKGKIFLNTLYTVGIFLCIITLVWGFDHKRYEIITGAVLIGAALVVLKIRLIKEVRTIINKRKP